MFPVNFEYAIDITKAYEDEGRWIVEGFAATSDFDLQEDVISQEAIAGSAGDLLENSTVLHNHNPNESIGKVLASRPRKGGLFLKILVSKTVPTIWQKIKEGVLNKFSVRGKILDAKKRWVPQLRKFARMILRMRLVEVSLVAVPANPKARAIRWYIEKALDVYEEAGGEIPAAPDAPGVTGHGVQRQTEFAKGGDTMGEEVNPAGLSAVPNTAQAGAPENAGAVEEDLTLLEGSGDPGTGNAGPEEAKGFPPPDQLSEGWAAHCRERGLTKESEGLEEAWVEFCKANAYPYPYPYPYPKPEAQRGARMRQIMELVDKLLPDEKDEERKKLLSQIREIARGASYAYPSPASGARKEEQEGKGTEGQTAGAAAPSGDPEPGLEKAGRKISTPRLNRLKKLVDELRKIIEEVEPTTGGEARKDDPPGGEADEVGAKLASIEETMKRLAESLDSGSGEKPGTEGETPPLEKQVKDLNERLGALEGKAGARASLDGQEELPGTPRKDRSLWKGVV